jgi:hypothetical protein
MTIQSTCTQTAAAATQPLIEGKYNEQQLLTVAKSNVTKKSNDCSIFNTKAEKAVPRFQFNGKTLYIFIVAIAFGYRLHRMILLIFVTSYTSPKTNLLHFIPKLELKLGRVLGRGGYCVVNEIVSIKLLTDDNTVKIDTSSRSEQQHKQNGSAVQSTTKTTKEYDATANESESEFFEQEIAFIVQDRSFMANHYIRGLKNDCRYAIKMLQDTNKNDASTYVNGVVDLAIEAKFLSVLQHDNIIKMRAIASCSAFEVNSCYFIILDRLYDTLTVRLGKWKKQQPTGMRKLLDRKGKREHAQFIERLTFAFDLSCALKYLHSKK